MQGNDPEAKSRDKEEDSANYGAFPLPTHYIFFQLYWDMIDT